MSSELARVELLARLFAEGARAAQRVTLGIGDDAAILAPSEDALVWTIDAQVEGVHFRRDLLALEDLGWRATMAAASDLAAMGARPLALLAALVLPRDFADHELEELARGQAGAACALGAPIAGGNLARGAELSITTTALGETRAPMRRSGARIGDAVLVAGELGLAAAGFACLERGLGTNEARAAIDAWRRPRARISEGLAASRVAHAAIDVSDGLARDLAHVARASGCSVELDAEALSSPTLAAVATRSGREALDLALHGGEDYALVIAAPAGASIEGFRRIGEVVEARSASLWLQREGTITPVDERGFDHFG